MDEKVRPVADREGAAEVKKEKQRDQHPDIERLIFHRALIEGPVRFVSGFAQTCSNQAHVIDEKQPDESGVGSAPANGGGASWLQSARLVAAVAELGSLDDAGNETLGSGFG